MLHPFMPFVTEELWQNMEDRKEGDTIMLRVIRGGNPLYIAFEIK